MQYLTRIYRKDLIIKVSNVTVFYGYEIIVSTLVLYYNACHKSNIDTLKKQESIVDLSCQLYLFYLIMWFYISTF